MNRVLCIGGRGFAWLACDLIFGGNAHLHFDGSLFWRLVYQQQSVTRRCFSGPTCESLHRWFHQSKHQHFAPRQTRTAACLLWNCLFCFFFSWMSVSFPRVLRTKSNKFSVMRSPLFSDVCRTSAYNLNDCQSAKNSKCIMCCVRGIVLFLFSQWYCWIFSLVGSFVSCSCFYLQLKVA